MIIKRLLILSITITLIACQADDLSVDENSGNQIEPRAAAIALSDADFAKLKPDEQYRVANKLAATLYKGVPASEFFDFSSSNTRLVVADDHKNFISNTKQALTNKIENKEGLVHAIELRYDFNESRKPTAEPLASIREYPISRDMLEQWMAYRLANTILFSPAEEIDSADYNDVQRIFDGLVKAMSDGKTIRDIILAHMNSQANWRRFRSPEDNTREMIEIYLGLFDRDADVPKASIACKNWYITDGDDGYELIKDFDNENTEPQKVLDEWVVTCEDFYRLIASHPLVIPRITTFLVDQFFPNSTSDIRSKMVQDIVAQNPVRFHDIFTAIIFSKEYLLYNERPKSFEETFFSIADRIDWKAESRFINELTDPNGGSPTLHNMKQPSMALKLGRFREQPMDSLSFAYYHSAVRERLLARIENRWGSWNSEFYSKGDYFDQQDYIDFLFLSVASRKASDEERNTLVAIIEETENEGNRSEQARIVLDYISRLPEIYYYNATNGGQG